MALTIVRETDPNGGNDFIHEGKIFEVFKITGDGVGGNADILLKGGRTPTSVRLVSGNITPAAGAYAVTLQPSASVDVRVVVPSSLTSSQYFYLWVRVRGL